MRNSIEVGVIMMKPLDSGTPPSPAPFSLTSLLESLKVLVVVLIVLGGQGASQAYSSIIDYSKINDAGFLAHLALATYHGFLAGAINGSARSIQVVMAIWVGPTIWKYVAP